MHPIYAPRPTAAARSGLALPDPAAPAALLQELYRSIAWPLYKGYGHAFDAFKLMVQDDGEAIIKRLETERGGPLEVLQPGVGGAAGSSQEAAVLYAAARAATASMRSTGSGLRSLARGMCSAAGVPEHCPGASMLQACCLCRVLCRGGVSTSSGVMHAVEQGSTASHSGKVRQYS